MYMYGNGLGVDDIIYRPGLELELGIVFDNCRQLGNTLELSSSSPIIFEQSPSIAQSDQRPELVIGFAAETEDLQENAIAKRQRKQCDWIIANQVGGADYTHHIGMSHQEFEIPFSLLFTYVIYHNRKALKIMISNSVFWLKVDGNWILEEPLWIRVCIGISRGMPTVFSSLT